MKDADSPRPRANRLRADFLRRHLLRATMLSPAIAAVGAALGMAGPAAADPAPFELNGPDLRIEVTRGQQTLPIAQVPSLAEDDKLSIHAALPDDQGLKFLLVSAFLRGATNPPPKNWISTASTWKSKEKDKALSLTVPKGARQSVLLMVPDTGGAEGVLVDAVRGKPGEFVRASQELNQASLDHSRLTAFMGAIQAQDDNGPEYLRSVAPVLARSLSIKLNEDCLSKVIAMQASCLLENRESLILSDVHSSSLADTLTGAPTDLALQLSATPQAGAGYYSAYIGVARDLARILGAFNNPQFGYLPTLSVRRGDTLSLLLNAAPSFQKPKSVMVAALPAVEADIPPQLRSTAKGPVCVVRPGAVLAVEGAPLIYSTDFAHDMKVKLTNASGQSMDVPITARADKGGYVLGTEALPSDFAGSMRARIHGLWGFAPFDGPEFLLQRPDGNAWKVSGDADVVVGRDNEVVLEGAAPSCVENVTLRQGSGAPKPLEWKVRDGNRLVFTVPLAGSGPGEIRVELRYQGAATPETVTLRARAEASRIDAFELHAGDTQGELTGQRLDQIRSLTLGDIEFQPDGLTREGAVDHLRLTAKGGARAPAQDTAGTAAIRLVDGRSISLPTRVAAARPQVEVIGRTVNAGPAAPGAHALELGSDDLLPDNGELVFSIRAAPDSRFGADNAIEIATEGGPVAMRLATGKGLTLESPQVLVARLRAADLPAGTFGPLRFRLVGDHDAGDWKPLATLARLPRIEGLACGTKGAAKATPCTLSGRDLFLIDAVSADSAFGQAVTVPPGFTGSTLAVPQPVGGKLHLRLRDAPESPVTLAS
ncbi:hypothetical protein EDF56_10338 [Novosphingobium sp. PhB165]|uniref:hypothetical protein n=1 Tax=Novosphingobium sp. PhB165 TaxID=2485105 RepID=UPI0010D43FC6|nr:hypothetical protein [Novosphingobium sp. PhB165]TCM19403.1 hypothetical protein EDF56_10338 [Novosphingobium sp. PhB165]